MASPKQKTFGYERDEHDWYVEPAFCTELLCKHVTFDGVVHDPACGQGNILTSLECHSYEVSGCDIVDRDWRGPMNRPRNYLEDA